MLRKLSGKLARESVDKTVLWLDGLPADQPVYLVDQELTADNEWQSLFARPAQLLGSWKESDGSGTAEVRFVRRVGGCSNAESHVNYSASLEARDIGAVTVRQTVYLQGEYVD